MAADGDVGEKSTFRCIDAVRYVLAFAVTVLIVTVIAHAIVVVLRPESLTLSVVGGSVSVKPIQSDSLPPDLPTLQFIFTLRAVNPSGRVRIYYTEIDGWFYGKNESTLPPVKFLRFTDFDNMTVEQHRTLDSNMLVSGEMSQASKSQKPYFDMLLSGRSIHDAILKMNGNLSIEINSRYNRTYLHFIYYCSPLTVGEEDMAGFDVQCTDTAPASIS